MLVSSGVKSYAIFTYFCGDIQWPGPAGVGYYAPPATFYNHSLAFSPLEVSELACTHVDSEWNNVIIDLQPGNVILPSTPAPVSLTGKQLYLNLSVSLSVLCHTGSCRLAGYEECCTGISCLGAPMSSPPCFCDAFCVFFGDCCYDASHICFGMTTEYAAMFCFYIAIQLLSFALMQHQLLICWLQMETTSQESTLKVLFQKLCRLSLVEMWLELTSTLSKSLKQSFIISLLTLLKYTLIIPVC